LSEFVHDAAYEVPPILQPANVTEPVAALFHGTDVEDAAENLPVAVPPVHDKVPLDVDSEPGLPLAVNDVEPVTFHVDALA